jgi:hypothetical protein
VDGAIASAAGVGAPGQGGSPGRRGNKREANVERTDWLDEGLDPAQAQFLMVTAITHHRFSSPLWGEDEVRKLQSELAEIELAVAQMASAEPEPEPSVSQGVARFFARNAHP